MNPLCIYSSILSLLLLLPVAKASDKPPTPGTAGPNIILIMSDDQGWGDVGFNGNDDIQTPNLDAMAAAGVKFNRFYAAAPLCSPTRGSCLTGRFPYRYGILAAHTAGMRVGEYTIAEMLKSKGFNTGFFGKWHVGWVKPDVVSTRGHYSPPSHHGYDESFATTGAVPTWDPTVTPKGWSKWGSEEGGPWKGGFPYMHNGKEAKTNLSGDDSRVIMDRVIPFIEQHADDRFFATVWFHTPHEPVVAGKAYRERYQQFGKKRQNYYGCITAMDEQIGRLRSTLRELGIEKETVLFFCSDNGPSDGLAKRGVASAGPFRGHKHQVYEGGILVPACMEWPGVFEEGVEVNARCSTVDFFPTIAKICDFKFKKKKARPIDGTDLLPLTEGKSRPDDKPLFFGFQRLYQSIDRRALILGNYKLVKNDNASKESQLFDLRSDPYEENDISQQHPAVLRQMLQQLAEITHSCSQSRDGADYRY